MLASTYIRGDRKRGPLAYADRVRAGVTRRDLAQLFGEMGLRWIVEIGVADGRFALTLCQSIPGIHYVGVDPWRPYKGNTRGGPAEQHEGNYRLAQTRLAPFSGRLLRMTSQEAAQEFPLGSIDAVYIDGNHAGDYVMRDLMTWAPRVRSGGVVAGHDFYHFERAGVVDAVVTYTKVHGITDWSLTDEREPSFWWVKP